jgi:hypothetical protein
LVLLLWGAKVVLIRSKFRADTYLARYLSSWDEGGGNFSNGIDARTLEEWYMYYTRYYDGTKFFLFDSSKELFQWMADE